MTTELCDDGGGGGDEPVRKTERMRLLQDSGAQGYGAKRVRLVEYEAEGYGAEGYGVVECGAV